MRQCIICFELKEIGAFNKEHVFPETIGGKICIQNVCQRCNEDLGKKIDTPFLNHSTVALLRIKHNLSRGKRDIKNPLNKYNTTPKESFFKIKNGKFYNYLKPSEKEYIKDGVLHIECSIDIEDFTEHTLPLMIENVSKKFGVSKDAISYNEKKSIIPAKSIIILEPNKPLIMEAAKIAYELTVEYIPNYLSTKEAKLFAKTLKTGDTCDEILFYITNNVIKANVFMRQSLWLEALESHFVLLTYVKEVGLIAVVKFFDTNITYPMWQVLLMSLDKQLSDFPSTLIINDFKNKITRVINDDIHVTGMFKFPATTIREHFRDLFST